MCSISALPISYPRPLHSSPHCSRHQKRVGSLTRHCGMRFADLVVPLIRGIPIWTPKYYSPCYKDVQNGTFSQLEGAPASRSVRGALSQNGTPIFGKPSLVFPLRRHASRHSSAVYGIVYPHPEHNEHITFCGGLPNPLPTEWRQPNVDVGNLAPPSISHTPTVTVGWDPRWWICSIHRNTGSRTMVATQMSGRETLHHGFPDNPPLYYSPIPQVPPE